MNEARKTSGSLALGGPARVITIPATQGPQNRRLRVAAYARVSSSSEDQKHSFAAQTAHYTDLITSHPDWDFVDVYADEGITGTSAEKREDFQRLLADCRRGRVDKILVKSSSRFARNAKDCLEAVRELKALGVGVCFEEQNIDTSELAGELLTALFAMMDQRESDADSQRMRMSYQQRMRSGHFVTCNAPFGYRLIQGRLEIIEEEAKIVRLIFDRYLAGHSLEVIAKELTQSGILPKKQGASWRYTNVQYLLLNEKYVGDTLLQKSYMTNTFPWQRKLNHGERDQILVRETHPPIVSREKFDLVQKLLKRRANSFISHVRAQMPLARSMFCGACGTLFRRKSVRGKFYWICRKHEDIRQECPVTMVPEPEVEKAFLRLYYKLRHQGMPVLHQLLRDLQEARKGRLLWSRDIMTLNNKIAELTRQERLLAELKQQGLVDPDLFISRRNGLAEQLRAVKLEKERLLADEEDQTLQQTQELLDVLASGPDFLDTFDGELFHELVERIIVENGQRLRFRLINGLELTEVIERTAR